VKIAMLGTGIVGEMLGSKLVELGHDVTMGGRELTNSKGQAWAAKHEGGASYGSFAQAAAFGEVIFCCVNGEHSIDALAAAGADNLAGKLLVDVGNLLDFNNGMPKSLASAENCLSEKIQAAFPDAHVVKSLNTMSSYVMVKPSLVAGDHNVFMSGDNAEAKAQLRSLLQSFGWADANIIDLGALFTARGPEMFMQLWLSLWPVYRNQPFNIGIFK